MGQAVRVSRRRLTPLAAIALMIAAFGASVSAEPMTYAQFAALKQPAGAERIAYGSGPDQFVELWLPGGPGPHPVVVMIHGGCWRASVARLGIMNLVSEDLRRRGIAVWNIEYRGVDQPGGGYPGTFQDVGAAIDLLRSKAPRHGLKLDKVVAAGHSAGGHLALWAAGRHRLPAASPLRTHDPLVIGAAINIAGLPDLEAMRQPGVHGCDVEDIAALAGPPAPERPNVHADTSPAELLPLGVRQLSVYAALDRIAPPVIGQAYTAQATAAGDPATLTTVIGAGHFELIAPGAPAWLVVAAMIEAELRE